MPQHHACKNKLRRFSSFMLNEGIKRMEKHIDFSSKLNEAGGALEVPVKSVLVSYSNALE
ncbi:hypothetical protein [Virgibacillus salexigens]|uniref:hypothetical protein n=1 Tax=Virgibacillus salexigens TaxID=61016 RepID=UPI00190DE7E7|nr:hypothetical protein [Virgibacillus salexigens]